MKILLDENIPARALTDFGKNFEVKSVKEMGWHGKKNGELLGLMVLNDFDFFITLDKNLKHQQNLKKFDVTIFLLNTRSSKHEIVQPYINKVVKILNEKSYMKFNEVYL